MRITSSLLLILAAVAPVASFAFAPSDHQMRSVVNEHQAIVQEHAEREQKPLPQIVEYRYGMKLDIAKVVRVSPDLKTCAASPRLMSYEDSSGALKTVQYKAVSGCTGKN
jgi:hypothetical protein